MQYKHKECTTSTHNRSTTQECILGLSLLGFYSNTQKYEQQAEDWLPSTNDYTFLSTE